MIAALASAAALLLAADVPASEGLRARVAQAPKPVAGFIERRANCHHFLGEEPYDRQRAAHLNRVIRELRCATIERDEARLRRVHRNDPGIARLLDDTADLLGW